jgi:hypothetical protein
MPCKARGHARARGLSGEGREKTTAGNSVSPREREKKARSIAERATIYAVQSERHGNGYMKVMARWRKAGGKRQPIAGTFAHVEVATGRVLSQDEMMALVRRSMETGLVLTTEESKAVLFALALMPKDMQPLARQGGRPI